jgi:replicative DNA helicase
MAQNPRLENQNADLVKLPADEESERIVLGAILVGHDQTAEVFELLNADDFDNPGHGSLMTSLKEMWEAGQPLELPALLDFLTLREKVDESGGLGYLTTLGEGVHSKMRLDKYAMNIRRARVRREFIRNANRWVMSIMEGEGVENVLDEAQDRIVKLSIMQADNDAGTTFRDAAMKMAMTILEGTETKPLYTGLSGVDALFGGFHPGELSIITAPTGTGKSHFAMQIARKSCESGRHILFASGEMLAEHLMKRVVASRSPIQYVKMRAPALMNMYDRNELPIVAMNQCKVCRVLDGDLSLRRIRAAIRLLKGLVGGLIVDYDELVEVRGKDEWEQQRILVRTLKSLAMEAGIPVILVSQLNKTAGGPRHGDTPSLQKLYGSSSKAKHASSVLYVDRPFVQDLQTDEAEAHIYVLKSRDGRMGKVECRFNVKNFNFEEVPHEQ